MPLAVLLPPDVEARLAAEAARAGVPPETLAADLLSQSLAPTGRSAALAALVASWLETAGQPGEREAGQELIRELNASRAEAGSGCSSRRSWKG